MSKKGSTQRLEIASTPGLGFKACTCHHADRDSVAVSSGSAADMPPQPGMELGQHCHHNNYHHCCLRLCQKPEVTG